MKSVRLFVKSAPSAQFVPIISKIIIFNINFNVFVNKYSLEHIGARGAVGALERFFTKIYIQRYFLEKMPLLMLVFCRLPMSAEILYLVSNP